MKSFEVSTHGDQILIARLLELTPQAISNCLTKPKSKNYEFVTKLMSELKQSRIEILRKYEMMKPSESKSC